MLWECTRAPSAGPAAEARLVRRAPRVLVFENDCLHLILHGQLLLLERDLFELLFVARVLERRQLAQTLLVAPVLARQLTELRVDCDQLLLQAVRVGRFHSGKFSFQMRGVVCSSGCAPTYFFVCARPFRYENVSPIPNPYQAAGASRLVMIFAFSTGSL